MKNILCLVVLFIYKVISGSFIHIKRCFYYFSPSVLYSDKAGNYDRYRSIFTPKIPQFPPKTPQHQRTMIGHCHTLTLSQKFETNGIFSARFMR